MQPNVTVMVVLGWLVGLGVARAEVTVDAALLGSPATPVAGTPVTGKRPRATAPRPAPSSTVKAPTVRELADLYMRVGRLLAAAARIDPTATIDLWPRFRWVNFNDAIRTPQKRAEAGAVLERLLADTRKLPQGAP